MTIQCYQCYPAISSSFLAYQYFLTNIYEFLCLSLDVLSSVQFSRSVVSDSLWLPWLQHARPPCPSPAPGVYSNSCPLSWWGHPTISSSVAHFSSSPQSFSALGSFPMNQVFKSGGQSFGASASAPVLPMSIQGWIPLDWLIWSPCSPRDSQELFPAP